MSNPVALVTPSYRNDIERFALLCESIDAHVSNYERHYVIVNKDDLALFQTFCKGRRVVLASDRFLPDWLRLAPFLRLNNGRRIWWSFRAGAVHGWHTQQILKISAASQLPEQRYCFADSDNVFFRPFDLGSYAGGARTPLYIDPAAIEADAPLHGAWTRNCDRLLGQLPSVFPADDFIGNQIVWDQTAVRAMTRAIEKTTGASWQEALCKTKAFSEYLLYGHFVRSDPAQLASHAITHQSLALAHWKFEPLTQGALLGLIEEAPADAVALCVSSFSNTPLRLVRSALHNASSLSAERSSRRATNFGAC
jgi:Family of unknown function (DUF6492)